MHKIHFSLVFAADRSQPSRLVFHSWMMDDSSIVGLLRVDESEIPNYSTFAGTEAFFLVAVDSKYADLIPVIVFSGVMMLIRSRG